MERTNERGVTLVALVVTIIILMILAGITLSLILGQNGIISKAKYAKMQSEIGNEKEQLSMAITEVRLDNNGNQPTLEQMKNKIVEKGITTADNIKVGDDRLQVTTPKGHTYTIDDSGDIEYVGEGAVTVPDLTESDVTFTYTPSTWTNGSVQVGIATTIKGFALQYSTDGSAWNSYTSAITVSSNETIYARLWDGINYGGVATGNVTNIDKINPSITVSTTNTTNSITVIATGIDNESGIAGYKYSKNNGSTWTDITTNNTYTYTGLVQNQAYQILVQAYDNVGNNTISTTEAVTTGSVVGLTSANTTFTYTPSTWTNGNVQVGMSTTETGYTLQYSLDGSTWNTYTSAINITGNQSVYARLYDGINYGGVTTGNVTNIDTTSPTLTLNQDTGTPIRTITINATDTQSGINVIQYNNAGTWQNVTTSDIVNGKSATYGVTSNGTYTFRTIDNVGNATSQDITVSGMVIIKSQVGDFVNYTAGTWTQADINSLGSLYSGVYLPGSDYKFGGFGVGSSKDSCINDTFGNSTKYSSGWRVLDLNGDGSIKDIVHAGTPEGFYFPYGNSSQGVTTLTSTRNWSMYVNSAYATSAHCMTYNEAKAATSDLAITGTVYWLASACTTNSLWYVYNSGAIIAGAVYNYCFGIRPVVSIKTGVQIIGGNGTQANPYQIK